MKTSDLKNVEKIYPHVISRNIVWRYDNSLDACHIATQKGNSIVEAPKNAWGGGVAVEEPFYITVCGRAVSRYNYQIETHDSTITQPEDAGVKLCARCGSPEDFLNALKVFREEQAREFEEQKKRWEEKERIRQEKFKQEIIDLKNHLDALRVSSEIPANLLFDFSLDDFTAFTRRDTIRGYIIGEDETHQLVIGIRKKGRKE